MAREAVMAAFGSSMHFLSGLALYLGAPLSVRTVSPVRPAQKLRRRPMAAVRRKKPLSEMQKRELLESIRNDDWHE
jgi:hypothetical protein